MKKKILSLILTSAMLSSFCVFISNVNAAELPTIQTTVAEDDFESFTGGLTHEQLVSSAYNGTSYREDGWGTAWTTQSYRTKPTAEGGVEFSIEDDGSGSNNVLKVKRNVFSKNQEWSNGTYPAGYFDTATSKWVGFTCDANAVPDAGARVIRKLDENFTNGTLNTSFKIKLGGGTQEATIGFGGLSTSLGYDSVGIRKNQIRVLATDGWKGASRYNYTSNKTLAPNEWYDVSITLEHSATVALKMTISITGVFDGDTAPTTSTNTTNLYSGETVNSCDISHIYFKSDRTFDLVGANSPLAEGADTYTSSIWYIDNLEVIKDEPFNPAEKIDWALISNNQPKTEVIDKLNLVNNITVDGDDYEITWATSDEDAIDIDGNIYPGNEAKTVTLTASDTEGNSKEFEITVLSSSEIDKYLVRANFDKYALGDAKNAIIWTHKYSDANGCYTNFNVVGDSGSRALHIERTVFGSGAPYKDQTGTEITESITAPDTNERYMPAMKENITKDEKVQIDTRVKFLQDSSTFSIRFDGINKSGVSPLIEIQTDEMINCMGKDKYERKSFPSKLDSGEYVDISLVVDFAQGKVELTAKGKSGGILKTQTVQGTLLAIEGGTIDIPSIGLMSRRDTSASTGVYIDYFRVKNITDSALNAITWDAISNGQDIANVTADLDLDETVTWTSSNETVITPSGVVSSQFSDTAVKLTATLDSGASKSFDVIVRSAEPAIVSVNFDDYNVANGTVVDGLGSEWTETYPSGSMKGVNYTVAQDPTNANNQVMKAERYIMQRNDQWVNGDTDEAVTAGPEADDIAKITFDAPVTEGNVTLSTRVMFTEGTKQSIGLNLYGLYDDADKNVVVMNRDEFGFWGYKDETISYGGFKAIPNVWYNVFFTIDFDNMAYKLKIGDLTFSDTVNDMEELSAIGIYSDSAYDTVETGTSVWYVDDVVVREGLSNAEAVSLAKADLSLPETTTENITLPTTGLEETTIIWATSDASVITKDGVVTVSEEEDKTVTLTATITKGNASDTKEFTIIVPAVIPYDIEYITPDVNGLQKSETPDAETGKYKVSLKVEYQLINSAKTVKCIVVKTDADGDILERAEDAKTLEIGTDEETFNVWFDALPTSDEKFEYYLWEDGNISLVDNAPSKVSGLDSIKTATNITLQWNQANDDSNIPVLYDIYKDGVKVATTKDTEYKIDGKAKDLLTYSVYARDWRKHTGANVDIETSTLQMYFANADGTYYGIKYNPSTDNTQDAYTVIDDVEKAYTQKDMVNKNRYIYFSRSGCDIATEDRELVFEIDYKARSDEDLYFVYNAHSQEYDDTGKDTQPNWELARKQGTVSKTIDLEGGWKTAVVKVTDAQLRESGQSSGSSFGIRIKLNTPSGTAILVREVRVIKAADYE